jgi:C4-dicarboxylate-specific signal transduction histidine kinase
MKVRKRMGMPKARMMSWRRADDAAKHSVAADIVEILPDRIGRDIIEAEQLAASQRLLLEHGTGLHVDAGESTVVKLAERIASLSNHLTSAMKRESKGHRPSVDLSSKK